MESQMDRAQIIHEQDPHHTVVVAEGHEDEHHREKESVLKKVKAKAKKIKDTLKKHGHNHDHDYLEHVPYDHDLDEEDDEDEEVDQDPEIHGAPIYEATAVRTAGQVGDFGTSGVNTGGSTVMDVDLLAPDVKPAINVHRQEEGTKGQHRVELTTLMDEVPQAPQNTPASLDPPGIHLSRDYVTPISLDPPGIDHSIDNVPSRTVMGDDIRHAPQQNMHVSLDPPGIDYSREQYDDRSRTFVHGQEDRPGQPKVNLERPKGLEEDPAAPKDTPGAYTYSNYQTKVTDPTGEGGEATGITSVLHSFDKMKVYDESEAKLGQELHLPAGNEDILTSLPTGSHDQFAPELTPPKSVTGEAFVNTKPKEYLHDETADRPSKQGSYTEKISSATTAIADRAVSAKNVVASNLGYDEKDSSGGQEMQPHNEGSERPLNHGGYTVKISSATSAIADKAVSAKNVLASKLGYGDEDNTGGHEMHGGGDKNSAPASAVDHGKKVASTVTEKLAPVYEKVAGAGSAVILKIPGIGTGSETTTTTSNQQKCGVEGQDKGVSVKDYFAEKLRPGEEDRALSEVISEALHKRKPEQEQQQHEATRPAREVVSDALHKRKEEPDEVVMSRPMGKVTESEEVARRLGTTKDNQDHGLGNNGMVDKIRGVVGSWLGKGDQSQRSQQSLGSSFGTSATEEAAEHKSSNITGERKLQESGN